MGKRPLVKPSTGRGDAERLLAVYADGLGERHTKVLASIFYDRLTQEQIGEDMGITQQGVSWLLKNALARLEAAGLPLPTRPAPKRLRYYSGRVLEQMR